jgi:hypothetical protein
MLTLAQENSGSRRSKTPGEICRKVILAVVRPPATRSALEGGFGLVEDQLDPGMDWAGLDLELRGEVGDGLLAAQMPTDDISFLLGGKRSSGNAAHGNYLRMG